MTTADLLKMSCVQSREITKLAAGDLDDILSAVPEWRVGSDGRRLSRRWKVRDYLAALEFFKQIAELAEREDHHPDLHLVGYRDLTIETWTHTVNGLTINDFILAAKIDALPAPPLHTKKTKHTQHTSEAYGRRRESVD